MFEQSIDSLLLLVSTRYGAEGKEILTEFRNKEILDTINSMDDEKIDIFYQIIEKNFFETEILLNSCIRNFFLPDEERFDYDSFYHTCYQALASLVNKGNKKDIKYLALTYNKLIKNIRSEIKNASDIRTVFKANYQIKDELKLSSAKTIYQFKKQIENYFKRLVRDYGFDTEAVITVDDILLLVDYLLNSVGGEDILSQLSFVNDNENLLNSLRNYEDEFKEILGKLAFDENNNFVILTKNFREEELEIYLYVLQELDRTKKVDEKTLLDSIFSDQNLSLQKIYSDK